MVIDDIDAVDDVDGDEGPPITRLAWRGGRTATLGRAYLRYVASMGMPDRAAENVLDVLFREPSSTKPTNWLCTDAT